MCFTKANSSFDIAIYPQNYIDVANYVVLLIGDKFAEWHAST